MMSLKFLSFYNLGDMVGSSGSYLNVAGTRIEPAGKTFRNAPPIPSDNNINVKSPF